jgi:hypothetical protein
MVLLDPGFACAGDVVWSLLWVLELDLGLVASFVELGLVVESVCARAPKQIVNIKGNTNESTRFIEGTSCTSFANSHTMVPREAWFPGSPAIGSGAVKWVNITSEDGSYGMVYPGV